MPIQAVANLNSANYVSYKQPKEEHKCDKASTNLKAGAFLTATAGTGIAYAIMLKKFGYSTNIAKALKTPLKDWSIFKVKFDEEKAQVQKLVGALAVGSVGGGLLGGIAFDNKENYNSKFRESIIQMVGNIATPLACVWAGMAGFKKLEPSIEKFIPKLKSANAQKFLKGVPSVLATGASLVAGIFLGNKVGNVINKNAFRVDDNRKIKISDMSPHLDDLCLAISLVAANSKFGANNKVGDTIARFIPAALVVAGVTTGIAKEKYDIMAKKAVEKAHKEQVKFQKQQFKANQRNCKN